MSRLLIMLNFVTCTVASVISVLWFLSALGWHPFAMDTHGYNWLVYLIFLDLLTLLLGVGAAFLVGHAKLPRHIAITLLTLPFVHLFVTTAWAELFNSLSYATRAAIYRYWEIADYFLILAPVAFLLIICLRYCAWVLLNSRRVTENEA